METQEIALRLIAAWLLGGLIGINRDLQGKPTGLRTMAIVCLGAASFTLVIHVISDSTDASVSRVIQGIVAGIGFLGAGVIMRDAPGGTVHGMTTAATLWATTAIGIGCALGQWRVTLIAFALIALVLQFGGPLERSIERLAGRKARTRASDRPESSE